MRILELFSGTESISKAFRRKGHTTITIDNNPRLNPTRTKDLLKPFIQSGILLEIQRGNYDVVWMSPPCQTLSMASGNKHWTIDRKPKTEDAQQARKLLNFCKDVTNECDRNNTIYFIENPGARARWFFPTETRSTVWYCQYGDNRAKPTDIWTNCKGFKPKTCKNNASNCHHERAPRGSKTGTQGLKGNIERGAIPKELCEAIVRICEKNKNEMQTMP